jgi:hypothetical protein
MQRLNMASKVVILPLETIGHFVIFARPQNPLAIAVFHVAMTPSIYPFSRHYSTADTDPRIQNT